MSSSGRHMCSRTDSHWVMCAHTHTAGHTYLWEINFIFCLPPSELLPFPNVQRRTEACHAWRHINTQCTHCAYLSIFPLPIWFMPNLAGKNTWTEGWWVPPTVGSETKVNWPGPGCFIALSISRGLRGGWTEVSSYYSWQRNKTTVSPGRARAAEKEPKMRQIVREDLGDGRKQRWRKKSDGRELQKNAEIKEEGKEVKVIPWVSGNVE